MSLKLDFRPRKLKEHNGTHKCFAPNGINLIFVNIFRAAKSIESCKTEGEKWCQILRDMSSYMCEPQEIGGGRWEKLAKASALSAHNKETIVKYTKAHMEEGYYKALVEESFEEGLEKGILRGIEQGIQEGAAEKTIEIAKTLLFDGVSIEKVCFFTGLTPEDVKKL